MATPTKSRPKALRASTARVRNSAGKPTAKKPLRKTQAKSSREKVKAHRDRMRKRGLRLIQIWVPDPSSPYFAAEARRQARLLANSPYEKDDQAFIDAISEWKPD